MTTFRVEGTAYFASGFSLLVDAPDCGTAEKTATEIIERQAAESVISEFPDLQEVCVQSCATEDAQPPEAV
jgi:hypothetical protein